MHTTDNQQPKPVLSWSLGWGVMPWIHVTADTWSNSTQLGCWHLHVKYNLLQHSELNSYMY